MKQVALEEVMSAHPHFVELHATLHEAQALMREHQIHHLPVTKGSILVGIVSQDDIHLAQSIEAFDSSTADLEDVMRIPLTVSTTSTVESVVSRMLDQGRDVAIVTDGARVVGIFTAYDAMRTLARLLANQSASTPSPRALPDV